MRGYTYRKVEKVQNKKNSMSNDQTSKCDAENEIATDLTQANLTYGLEADTVALRLKHVARDSRI